MHLAALTAGRQAEEYAPLMLRCRLSATRHSMGGGSADDKKESAASMKYPYWVVEGKVYDFVPFIPKHPGGTRWFSHSHGRDITAAVHHYHENPVKLRPILKKYEVKGVSVKDAIDPGLNVPRFILPEVFDARIDTPEITGDP